MNANTSDPEGFVRHQVVDRQHQNMPVSTFLIPAGWRAETEVYWNYQHSNFPVTSRGRVSNPAGAEQFEFLPSELFFWGEPDYGLYPQGQNVGGSVYLPPLSGVDALTRLVIPKYRGDRHDLRITGGGPVPNLVLMLNAKDLEGRPYEGVKAKLEYTEQGRALEEEFYACHIVNATPPMYGPTGPSRQINWGLTRLFCFRADRGRLDDSRHLFWRIASSLKGNPQWQQFSSQLTQRLQQQQQQGFQQQLDQFDQMGRERLRMNQQASDQFVANNQAYIDRQDERIRNSFNTPPPPSTPDYASGYTQSDSSSGEYGSHEAHLDTVREQESFYNPNDTSREKVSGYHDYIWTDQTGNVRTSNDPNYDPNDGTGADWTLARKKRIGD